MKTNPTIGDVIIEKGFSQGVIITGASMRYICRSATENHDWITQCDALVVLSQDCDLFQDSLEKEPFAEFFCIMFRDIPNRSLMYGKNPRILHLVENKAVYEVLIYHRIRVERECLLEHIAIEPNQRLSEESLRLLLFWMTNRYNRYAFPDAFNVRLSKIARLDTKLTRLNEKYPLVKRFFFRLCPNTELLETESYALDILVLLDGRSERTDLLLKKELEAEVASILSQPGIRLEKVFCAYEDEVSLYDLKFYRVWNKDYISRKNRFVC